MEFTINKERYTCSSTLLGEGKFAQVYLYRGTNGSTVAVKQQTIRDKIDENEVNTEYKILASLQNANCQHIIKLFGIVGKIGVSKTPTTVRLVMEYAEGGNLHQKTICRRECPYLVKQYFQQIITGVKFLHENGICHWDIKPENCLLDKDGIVKICDFGKAGWFIIHGGECVRKVEVGTANYAAPEVFRKDGENKFVEPRPVDVFACGVTLLHMSTRSIWENVDHDIYKRWEMGQCGAGDFWKGMEPQLLNLLKKIICTDVRKRATITEIENDQWFKDDSRQLRYNPKKKTIFEN